MKSFYHNSPHGDEYNFLLHNSQFFFASFACFSICVCPSLRSARKIRHADSFYFIDFTLSTRQCVPHHTFEVAFLFAVIIRIWFIFKSSQSNLYRRRFSQHVLFSFLFNAGEENYTAHIAIFSGFWVDRFNGTPA